MNLGQDWHFISKNKPGLWCSHPLKSSPSSHFLLVSNSVGTSLLPALPFLVSLTSSHLHYLCFLVSKRHPFHGFHTYRGWNLYTLVKTDTKQPSWHWRSHDNNVRDIIIAHMISADAQIYIHTNRRRKRKVILGPAGHTQSAQLAGKSINKQ